MIKSIFYHILKRKNDKQFIKTLSLKKVELSMPFEISTRENLILGKNVYIGPNCWFNLLGKLRIGNGTIIGPHLKVHTANHNYESNMIPYNDEYSVKDVNIGDYVWIGADVSIMPGVKIGDGVVVAACSVITKDIPPMAVVGGNPARILKYRNKENYDNCLQTQQCYLEKKWKKETSFPLKKRFQ